MYVQELYALFKLPKDDSTLLVRAFPFIAQPLHDLLEDIEQKKTSKTPEIRWGFSSTSTSLEAAAKFMGGHEQPCVQYLIDPGSSARDVSRYSAYQHGDVPEEERLLPMGSAFRVTGAVMLSDSILQVKVCQVDDFVLPAAKEAAPEELEAEQEEIGRLDREMKRGTTIFVVGHGRGKYDSFERSTIRKNFHTVTFDTGIPRTKVLQLWYEEWSVCSAKMTEMAEKAQAAEEAKAQQEAEAELAPYIAVIARLRAASRSRVKDPSLARETCRQLGSMLVRAKADGTGEVDPDAQRLAANAGSVAAVREALSIWACLDVKVSEATLKVLRALLDNSADNCRVLAEAGGVGPIVEAIVQHIETSAITENGAMVLMNMALYSRGSAGSDIVDTGAVEVLTNVLMCQARAASGEDLDNQSIVTLSAGCDALHYLIMYGQPEVCIQVEKAGVVGMLTEAMPALQERYSERLIGSALVALSSLDKRIKSQQSASTQPTDQLPEGVPPEPETEPEHWRQQVQALEARLAALHETGLLEHSELHAIKDILSYYIMVRSATTSAVTAHTSDTAPRATANTVDTTQRLVALSEGVEDDATFARQMRKLVQPAGGIGPPAGPEPE